MVNRKKTRRLMSIVVAVTMMMPALSSVAEAAIGTWLSPQPDQQVNTRSVEVSVGYNTQSDVNVTSLELWIDGAMYAKKTLIRPDTRGVCSFTWDTSRASRGSHKLAVKIFAGDELISTVTGTGTVGERSYDLRPPTVKFSNVKSGDVLKGTTSIRISATDDGGDAPIVSLLVDNALKLLTNRMPYAYDLDTTKFENGSHELQTFAYDSAGNKSDPSVVKVSFKNDSAKPVVAAMSVQPSATVAASEDDGVGDMLPPVKVASKHDSAARNSDSSADFRSVSSGPVASSRVDTPDVMVDPVIRHPQTAQVSSPKSTVAVVRPADEARSVDPSASNSLPRPGMRQIASAGSAKSSVTAAEPAVRAEAAESSAGVVPGAASPSVKGVDVELSIKPGTAVRPTEVASPTASEAKAVAALPIAGTRTIDRASSARSGAVAPREELTAPVSASAGGMSAKAVPGVRMARAPRPDGSFSGTAKAPGGVAEAARAAQPRPVRVAMAPSLRMRGMEAAMHGTIICPPPARKESKAKIEKRTLPASGKLKLRDLFHKLGGVVFWDAESHTVTAYAQGMKLEMEIGSSKIMVNGKEMLADSAPFLADGRTIIDATVFRQACAMVEAGTNSASAK